MSHLSRSAESKPTSRHYYVIYDGNCNLCVNFVCLLETLDQGQRFQYAPMQDEALLRQFEITPQDCELGMLLIDAQSPEQRWQGSEAAEEIGRLLPLGAAFVQIYRAVPGFKWGGDRLYEHVRDNRYALFGQRRHTYQSHFPVCGSGSCAAILDGKEGDIPRKSVL